jgi:hypothetical protein
MSCKQFFRDLGRRSGEYFTIGILAAIALGAPRLARATEIFAVDLTVGSGSVIGTITTDGILGTLAKSDIVGLDLTITAPFGSAMSTNLSDFFAFSGNDLSETASALTFNFGGASTSGFTILTDDGSQAWSTGGGVYLPGICSSACDPNGTPGLEDDSRQFPVYYTEQTGAVAIGTVGTTQTPEPGTLFLFFSGLIGLGVLRTRWSDRFVAATSMSRSAGASSLSAGVSHNSLADRNRAW